MKICEVYVLTTLICEYITINTSNVYCKIKCALSNCGNETSEKQDISYFTFSKK